MLALYNGSTVHPFLPPHLLEKEGRRASAPVEEPWMSLEADHTPLLLRIDVPASVALE